MPRTAVCSTCRQWRAPHADSKELHERPGATHMSDTMLCFLASKLTAAVSQLQCAAAQQCMA